jgi:hypothetical protein
MSVNLKIGLNTNFTTNISHTKFLGVTMNNNFSWNNHIDLLMKKLSQAYYTIRNAKTYMSASSLKVIYYAFFSLGYELWNCILGGNSSHISIIFKIQEKAIRIMEGCGNRDSCRNLFKKLQILPLTSQYMLSLLYCLYFKIIFFLNKQWKSKFRHQTKK